MRYTLPGVSAAACLFGASLCPGQSFQFLPSLVSDYPATALGISGDGHVVVGHGKPVPPGSGGMNAVAWRDGVVIDLGSPGGINAAAYGASFDGSVAVGYTALPNGHAAARWINGSFTQIAGPATASLAYAASADGSVIVGRGSQQGFRFDASGYSTIGTLPAYTRSYAKGVSADGALIVGTSSNDSSSWNPGRAFRWQGGSMQSLEPIPFLSRRSEAVDVSPDGSWTVGWSYDGIKQATAWDGHTTIALGYLPIVPGPGQWLMSEALGVAVDGRAIVGASGVSHAAPGVVSNGHAFLWTQSAGMVDLNLLIESMGFNLDDWVLYEAVGISDDGHVIAGNAWSIPLQVSVPWVAVIPTPGAGAVVMMAGAVWARRRRRV